MARRRGSVAPASTRRCKIPLSMLQHGLHNLPHSSKHVDVLELMLGRSMLDGQLPSGLSAWPVPLIRAGTSSRVAGVAGRAGSMDVSLGRVPRCHGGPSRAGRGVGAFATRARCVGGGMGRSSPSVAFMRYWAAGRIVRWFVPVFGAKSVLRLCGATRTSLFALRVLWIVLGAARSTCLLWAGRWRVRGSGGPTAPCLR